MRRNSRPFRNAGTTPTDFVPVLHPSWVQRDASTAARARTVTPSQFWDVLGI